MSLHMFELRDSYGDGWNGNEYRIESTSATNANGAVARLTSVVGTLGEGLYEDTQRLCLSDGCYTISVGGGSWMEEVTWQFGGVTGGAPVEGVEVCLGSAGDADADVDGDAVYPAAGEDDEVYPEA